MNKTKFISAPSLNCTFFEQSSKETSKQTKPKPKQNKLQQIDPNQENAVYITTSGLPSSFIWEGNPILSDKLYCLMMPEESRVPVVLVGMNATPVKNTYHWECMGAVLINGQNLYDQDTSLNPMTVINLNSNKKYTMTDNIFLNHLKTFYKAHGNFYIVRTSSITDDMDSGIEQFEEQFSKHKIIHGGQYTICKSPCNPLINLGIYI